MRAAVLKNPYVVACEDVAAPLLRNEDDVIIKVHAVGICGSDVHAFKGHHPRRKPPVVLGHELVGEVVETGSSVRKLSAGDLVTVEPQIHCGSCYECSRGFDNLCKNKLMLGTRVWPGAMSEHIAAHCSAVHKLSGAFSIELGALVEPFAVAVRAVKRGGLRGGEKIAVLGAGNIGILILMLARYRGADTIVATDIAETNLAAARKAGATYAVNAAGEPLEDQINRLELLHGLDVVFICADKPSLINDAIRIVRSQGTIVIVSLFPDLVSLDMQEARYREISIVGTTSYTTADFKESIDLIARIPADMVSISVSHKMPLEEAQRGFDLMDKKDRGVLKVLLYPGGARG